MWCKQHLRSTSTLGFLLTDATTGAWEQNVLQREVSMRDSQPSVTRLRDFWLWGSHWDMWMLKYVEVYDIWNILKCTHKYIIILHRQLSCRNRGKPKAWISTKQNIRHSLHQYKLNAAGFDPQVAHHPAIPEHPAKGRMKPFHCGERLCHQRQHLRLHQRAVWRRDEVSYFEWVYKNTSTCLNAHMYIYICAYVYVCTHMNL